MRHLFLFIATCVLPACTVLGNVEEQALRIRAESDARRQSPEIHLAYLQCYALSRHDKKQCRRRIGRTIDGRKGARSWEYILPFDYEAERLGFERFLEKDGLKCDQVKRGPRYDREHKAYRVVCENGRQYFMRFDRDKKRWSRVEEGDSAP